MNRPLLYLRIVLPSGAVWFQTGVAWSDFETADAYWLKVLPHLRARHGEGIRAYTATRQEMLNYESTEL